MAIKKNKKQPSAHLPAGASESLRGKQSVRATFKLTRQAINAISAVAIHLNIRQKALFDHLISDTKTLEQIASEIDSAEFRKIKRVQKTYVLSRQTLSILEKMCSRFSIPRDALVEYSVQRLLPIIEKEQEKHVHRKELLKSFNANRKNLQEIADASFKILGKEDPISAELKKALLNCRNASHEMSAFIEKGKIIETFPLISES